MNKMLKKIISVALAMAMVVTTVYVGNPTTAQAKVTIKSKKTVTLIAGNSSKIKVKQKGAKFTSSNKKIATVSKKGKIKAKKPGTCKITVKVKKSKKKVTVKVTPGATSIAVSYTNLDVYKRQMMKFMTKQWNILKLPETETVIQTHSGK